MPFSTIVELEADPSFRRLSFVDQQRERARFVDEKVRGDTSIPDDVKIGLLNEALQRAPVLSQEAVDGHKETLAGYADLLARSASGDQGARAALEASVTNLALARSSFMTRAVYGGASSILELFGEDATFKGISSDLQLSVSKDGEKLQKILERGAGLDTGLFSYGTLGSMIGKGWEFTTLNNLLVGTLAKPGVLTGELFTKASARMTAKLAGGATGEVGRAGRLLWGAAAPFIVEKGAEGLVDASVDLAEALLQGDIRVPKDAALYFAKGFGEGLMVDLVFHGLGSGMKKIGGAIGKVYRSNRWIDMDLSKDMPFGKSGAVDLLTPEVMEKYLGGQMEKDFLDQLPADEAAKIVAGSNRLHTMLVNAGASSDPRTPDGFRAFALAQGFEADVLADGRVKISDYVLQKSPFAEKVLGNLQDAQLFMSDYRRTIGQTTAAKMQKRSVAALSKSMRISRLLSADIDPTSAPKEFLAQAVLPVGGKISGDSLGAFGKAFVKATGGSADDVLKLKVETLDNFYEGPVNVVKGTIFAPKEVANAAQESAWMKSLREQLRGQAREGAEGSAKAMELFDSLRLEAYDGPLTLEGLNLLVEGRLGGEVVAEGARVSVRLPSAGTASFNNLGEASRWLGRTLVENGYLDDDQLGAMFTSNTGLGLHVDVDEVTGVKTYTPTFAGRAPQGRAFSLDELLESYPQALDALPQALAPKVWFVGEKLVQQGDVIVGSARALREYAAKFRSFTKVEELDVEVDGTISKVPMRQSFLVEDASSGTRAEFPTYKAAKKFLNETVKREDFLTRAAYAKGLNITANASGDMVVSGQGLEPRAFRTKKALMNFLATKPDPENAGIIEGLDDPFAEEVVSQARARLEEVDPASIRLKGGRLISSLDESPIADSIARHAKEGAEHGARWHAARAFGTMRTLGEPGYDSVVRTAAEYGVPELGGVVERFGVLRRATDSATMKASQLMKRIFEVDGKPAGKATLSKLSFLMEYPEELWEKVAATQGFKIESSDRMMLQNARKAFDALGAVAGIEDFHKVFQYAPHIREGYMKELSKGGSLKDFDSLKFLRSLPVFGGALPDQIKFAHANMRWDSLVTMMTRHNLLEQMTFYASSVYRKTYMGDYWAQQVVPVLKRAKDKLPQPVLKRMTEFFQTAMGYRNTPGEWVNQDISIHLTTALSQMLLKFPDTSKMGKLLHEVAEKVITNDLSGKLSHRQTMGMLAFRPWRGIANLSQYTTNGYALFGRKAFDVMDQVDDAYIAKAYKEGYLAEAILGERPTGGKIASTFEQIGLAPQEKSEVLTRVWTLKASENAFREALPAYASGSASLQEFMRLCRGDVLLLPQQQMFLRLVKEGKTSAAERMLKEAHVRLAMGDYSREGAPRAFQGWIGRAFGKFGVYSVAHVNFMARLAGSGDAATRAASLARMGLASTATYYAFKALGADYNGFLFTDPYEFSGGPTITMLIDGVNAIGDRPENEMARKRLLQTGAASVFPGALAVRSATQAAEAFQAGDTAAAFWALMGVRPSEDSIWNGGIWY